MAAYSLDLRKKILSAWQNKENTQRGLAKRFKVSLSFVRDFLRRYRETNEIAARPQGGDRRCKIKGENLSGAENSWESQDETMVIRANSIRKSNFSRLAIEAEAGGGLVLGKICKIGRDFCW